MTFDYAQLPESFYRISIKALILNTDGKFMLMRENDDRWALPGGGLDFGEKPFECLSRELIEESNIKLLSMQEQPFAFFTAPNPLGFYNANVVYQAIVDTSDFIPTVECLEFNYFSAHEAMALYTFPGVSAFADLIIKDNLL